MRNCPNPNCRQPVRSDWNCCVYCGTPLPPSSSNSALPYMIIGAVLFIAVMLTLFFVLDLPARLGLAGRPNPSPSQPTQLMETEISAFDPNDGTQPDLTPFVNQTRMFEPTIIIVTATPESTATKTKTPTPGKTCPDTFSPRVAPGDRAKVCTRRDRLIIRVEPNKGEREIARIYPGTIVKILNGPECADKSSWWWIQVSKGTEVFYANLNRDGRLEEDLFGWVREGGDTEDRYYLCKIED